MIGRVRVNSWVLGLVLLASGAASGKEMPVDSERQGAMFKRIFSYDKLLRDSERIVVLVVGASRTGKDVESVADAFREEGLFPAIVPVGELTDDLTATLSPASTVLYVMPDVDYAAARDFAERKRFLTVSGLPSLVEAGQVSVSVDVVGERTEVLVNMPRLATEGHALSSELLKLARVIR